MSAAHPKTITLGDPVPWFMAKNISGGKTDLHISAGRWVLLAFMGSLESPEAKTKLAGFVKLSQSFTEDHLITYIILSAPPADAAQLLAHAGATLKFVADYDNAIGAHYGAGEKPRTVALDPLLRAIADITWDNPDGHDVILNGMVRGLPKTDDAAGVPLTAPALIVPRVFDFPLCEFMVDFYNRFGGTDSGFLIDKDGKTSTVIDHSKKRRQDLVIALPELREKIRERIVARLLPAIELYFSFKATRMDRYIVSCYDAAIGGHFFRHRDNLNAGAEHRRFAVSMNLNTGYDGCDLIFPEFGRRTYRAPVGGAIVFSCGALHQVTPITKGKRYAFLPFLYGEEDAKKRLANNARLNEGETPYKEGQDRLFPDASAGAEQPKAAGG